ncbi:hypothetical protein SAMN05421846_11610 [Chryseobacterium taeanense]|uniref:Uncharacterized protein n=1 Tax=Chryseobacterium taeanense TaxID=311334 RepID=A0A1G8NZI1_9FLAO|nr:hypothetical protein SAMN05421846_11610 [Chryseobacterium taeanense]
MTKRQLVELPFFFTESESLMVISVGNCFVFNYNVKLAKKITQNIRKNTDFPSQYLYLIHIYSPDFPSDLQLIILI